MDNNVLDLDAFEKFEGEDIQCAGKIPLGWKFCPTDEELIIHYLQNRIQNQKLPYDNVINEVHLYESDITDIIESYKSSEQEGKWYFFTNRERRYPNGDRPGRSTPNGFWKATGADVKIWMKNQETGENKNIGLKKTLNFFYGKQTGESKKSGWTMYEYRIKAFEIPKNNSTKDMQLDDAVLCKVYYNGNRKSKSSKKNTSPTVDQQSPDQIHAISDSAFRSLPPNQNFSFCSTVDITNHVAQNLNHPDPSYMLPPLPHPDAIHNQTQTQCFDPHSVYVPCNPYNHPTSYPQSQYLHVAYGNGGGSLVPGNSTYYNMAQYQPHSSDSVAYRHQPNWTAIRPEQFSFRASCYPRKAIPFNYIHPYQTSFSTNNSPFKTSYINRTFQSGNSGAQEFDDSLFGNMMGASHDFPPKDS